MGAGTGVGRRPFALTFVPFEFIPCIESKLYKRWVGKWQLGVLAGGPVVKTTHYHCRGYRFDPLLGN